MAHQWTLEIFECLAGVDLPVPEICKIGGWVKEPFAIDPRWYNEAESVDEAAGWMITHLPTGFCCFGVVGNKQLAFQIADELAAGGQWEFVDPSSGAKNSEIVKSLRAKYPQIKAPRLFEKALWLDGGKS